jgi:hypothetical protein
MSPIVVDRLLEVEHVVEAESHVVRTDQLDEMIQVAKESLGTVVGFAVRPGTDERAVAHHADDPARVGTGPGEIVGDVSGMGMDRVGVRVGEDDRTVGSIDHVSSGLPARMRAAGDHADSPHLGHHLAPEGAQAAAVEAAAADRIGPVVGQQHPPDAEVVVQFDHAELISEADRTLEIEADAEAAGLFGAVDVGHGLDLEELVRVAPYPVAKVGRASEVVLHRHRVVADVERDDGMARIAMAAELRQKRVVRSERHAGVIVPHHRPANQLFG